MNPESTQILDAGVCWDYLRSSTVGRLAVIVADAPEIFPVNFAIEHSALLLRTGAGTKVDAIRANPHVAFEIDGFDSASGTAWSVVLKGTAKEVVAAEELQETVSIEVTPWQSGMKNHFIRILAEEVTGRRFTVADPATWDSPYSRVARAPQE